MLSLDVFECFLFFNSSNAARDPVPVEWSWYANAGCLYDFVLAAATLRIFGSDDEHSGLAGVYTFNSSDRYFGYAVGVVVLGGSVAIGSLVLGRS